MLRNLKSFNSKAYRRLGGSGKLEINLGISSLLFWSTNKAIEVMSTQVVHLIFSFPLGLYTCSYVFILLNECWDLIFVSYMVLLYTLCWKSGSYLAWQKGEYLKLRSSYLLTLKIVWVLGVEEWLPSYLEKKRSLI